MKLQPVVLWSRSNETRVSRVVFFVFCFSFFVLEVTSGPTEKFLNQTSVRHFGRWGKEGGGREIIAQFCVKCHLENCT